MATNKDREIVASLGQAHRALLIELKGVIAAGDGGAPTNSTETFAALSMEEVVAYVRGRQQSAEIMELKGSAKCRCYPVPNIWNIVIALCTPESKLGGAQSLSPLLERRYNGGVFGRTSRGIYGAP